MEKLNLIVEEFCEENEYIYEINEYNKIIIDIFKNNNFPSNDEFFYKFGIFVATKYSDYIDSFKPYTYYYDGFCPEEIIYFY